MTGDVGSPEPSDPLFAGPGEMRARCRAVDWTATPLGPVQSWPQAVRSAVRLCLDSPTPMTIWGGPEFTLIYNEAYATVLASKHPWALGRTAREVLPEVWGTLQGEFEQVLEGTSVRRTEAAYRVDRVGRDHAAVFTYSLTPLREEDGRIVGVFNLTEELSHLVGELRTSEARQAFLVRLGDVLQPLNDPFEIQAAAAELLREHLQATRIHFAEVEPDGEHATVQRDYAIDVVDRAGRYALADFPHLAGEMRAGRTLVVDDVSAAGMLGAQERATYLALPVAALVAVPIRKDSRFTASLSVHRSSPHPWGVEDVGLIEATAARAWDAVLRARAEAALRVSEERFRRALETMSEGYAILSPDWRYLFVNKFNADQARSTIEDMLGRSMFEVAPGIEKTPIFEAFRSCMEERTPRRLESAFTYADGSSTWFELVVEPVAEGILVRVQDITERKRAEEALREADRRKDHFMAVLSHELRNPLAPIVNGLAILDRAPAGSEQAHRARAVIKRQVDQLSHLVDDLLDVTRITSGKVQLQRERLELGGLVSRTLDDHRCLFEEAGLELEVTPCPLQVFVDADGSRIAQVIGNLLLNAAKFTPPHGRVTVALSVDPSTRQAVLRVSDTGVGIAPLLLAQLFEPFVQADTTLDRSEGGLGLGLAIVKGLVEEHGGSVTAASEGPGRGAALTVRLPLEEAVQSHATSSATPSSRLPPRRVLIIEDNTDAAETLQDVLKLYGHEVAVASSGPAGIALAREFHPDLVLCDIGLPDMDGFAVARLFRADEHLKHAHLVALSGYVQQADLQRAADAGFERHLAKPPDFEKIEEVLRDLR